MIKYFSCTLLLLGIHLNSKTSIQANANATFNSIQQQTTDARKIDSLNNHSTLFDNHKPFEISRLTNTFASSSDTDTAKCKNWKLTKENIIRIIKHSKAIGGTTWDFDFSVLSCSISGKLLQNHHEYKIEINAGSFFWVSNKDITLLFGDYNKADSKYFIDKPYQ